MRFIFRQDYFNSLKSGVFAMRSIQYNWVLSIIVLLSSCALSGGRLAPIEEPETKRIYKTGTIAILYGAKDSTISVLYSDTIPLGMLKPNSAIFIPVVPGGRYLFARILSTYYCIDSLFIHPYDTVYLLLRRHSRDSAHLRFMTVNREEFFQEQSTMKYTAQARPLIDTIFLKASVFAKLRCYCKNGETVVGSGPRLRSVGYRFGAGYASPFDKRIFSGSYQTAAVYGAFKRVGVGLQLRHTMIKYDSAVSEYPYHIVHTKLNLYESLVFLRAAVNRGMVSLFLEPGAGYCYRSREGVIGGGGWGDYSEEKFSGSSHDFIVSIDGGVKIGIVDIRAGCKTTHSGFSWYTAGVGIELQSKLPVNKCEECSAGIN